MNIDTEDGPVVVRNEPTYSFASRDNVRSYKHEIRLKDSSLTSIHGVSLNGDDVVIVGAAGGCSTVHARSAVAINDLLYLAVGDHVACLSLTSPHPLIWSMQVDAATCFGIYWVPERSVLISHGELEVSCLLPNGTLLWQTSGADIFTEGLSLLPSHIEVMDFNKSLYRLDYVTGEVLGC
ncbi:hypothetical protein [Ralstonia pseudosolanacearum]|uniref:hypothetical protein n=1 Tax=Ralstonia pseudosolanacearum TaxID=1310165 RepID=UPI0026771E89|nr:hypothetical protein [Ralstonia pseudosolanacearum]MDO3521942.1 hypothetical protein [Ralstonia pseudosolanacearum]